LKEPERSALKLKCDELFTNYAYNFNLRQYSKEERSPQILTLKLDTRGDLWRVLMLHPGAYAVRLPETFHPTRFRSIRLNTVIHQTMIPLDTTPYAIHQMTMPLETTLHRHSLIEIPLI
jgi:hypothetical protein